MYRLSDCDFVWVEVQRHQTQAEPSNNSTILDHEAVRLRGASGIHHLRPARCVLSPLRPRIEPITDHLPIPRTRPICFPVFRAISRSAQSARRRAASPSTRATTERLYAGARSRDQKSRTTRSPSSCSMNRRPRRHSDLPCPCCCSASPPVTSPPPPARR